MMLGFYFKGNTFHSAPEFSGFMEFSEERYEGSWYPSKTKHYKVYSNHSSVGVKYGGRSISPTGSDNICTRKFNPDNAEHHKSNKPDVLTYFIHSTGYSSIILSYYGEKYRSHTARSTEILWVSLINLEQGYQQYGQKYVSAVQIN